MAVNLGDWGVTGSTATTWTDTRGDIFCWLDSTSTASTGSIYWPIPMVPKFQRSGAPAVITAVPPPADPTPEGFNRWMNASDLLAAFAAFAEREAKFSRTEFLELPLKYFVQWLVLESAAAAGEAAPEGIAPVKIPKRLHCRACGRFLPNTFRALGVSHCNPAHLRLSLARAGAVL